MSDEQELTRPPASGPGSGLAAWRAYAAALTGTPAESWESLSRDEIAARLDTENADTTATAEENGDEQAAAPAAVESADEQAAPVDESTAEVEPEPSAPRKSSGRRMWMVHTENGPVPEHEMRGR